MKRICDEAFFLGFCVEIYKTEKKMTGQDAFNHLYRTGATGFIIKCREGLHMTSPLYIIDSIDDFIKISSVNQSIETDV